MRLRQFEKFGVRQAGRYISRCIIPADMLNEGRYVLGLNASIFRVNRFFQDERALTFTVDAVGAPGKQWPETRMGLVRPRLAWEIEHSMNNRIKQTLGNIPYSAEFYWWLRRTGKPPVSGYSMEKLQANLARMGYASPNFAAGFIMAKKCMIFSMLPYWIEQTIMLALALAALGYDVSLAYLPYAHWKKPVARFDARRQNVYMREVLKPLEMLLNVIPLLDAARVNTLPEDLATQIPASAYRDVQYSLLREDVDDDSDLYHLRMKRNETHAGAMLRLLQTQQPDVVIVPNGSILSLESPSRWHSSLDIQTSTYEFGEQSERLWMAQNADVMRQETDHLWSTCKEIPLSDEEWSRVKDFFSTRQEGGLWENFSRSWQGTTSQGGDRVRTALD